VELRIVDVQEAQTHLSKLLEQVSLGEEIIIARAGKPVARLTAVSGGGKTRVTGSAAGRFTMSDDFDAPLPDDILGEFERR
jgi:prevent-host-death family protein